MGVSDTDSSKRLIAASTEIMSEKDHCRFAAMITIAFFGFLCPSEFCITSANHELKRSAVKFGKKGLCQVDSSDVQTFPQ